MCDILEGDGGVMKAIACFREMQRELTADASTHNERAQWELGEWSRSDAAQACLSFQHRFSTAVQTEVGKAR